jgi:Nuclease-related domain
MNDYVHESGSTQGYPWIAVNAADGTKLLSYGKRGKKFKFHVEDNREELVRFLKLHPLWSQWHDSSLPEATTPPVKDGVDRRGLSQAPVAPALDTSQPWTDLKQNKPGEALQRKIHNDRGQASRGSALRRFLQLDKEDRSWVTGWKGEQDVANNLKKLRKEWQVLHSIPIGVRYADLDHLVIGPGGIFAINAKHHPKAEVQVTESTIKVAGYNQKTYRKSAENQARRVAEILSPLCSFPPIVTPVIAIKCKAFTNTKAHSTAVHVVRTEDLAGWLSQLGPQLSQHQVEQVFEIARRSTIWQSH